MFEYFVLVHFEFKLDLLASTFSLVPDPKMSLFPVYTQQETPLHKLYTTNSDAAHIINSSDSSE